MMRFRFCLAVAVAIGVTTGCGQPKEQASKAPSDPPSTGPVASNTKKPSVTTEPASTEESPKTSTPPTTGSPSKPNSTNPTKPGGGSADVPIVGASWVPATRAARDIAAETDAVIIGLANVKVEINYGLKNYLGQATGTLVQEIKNAKVYSLQYPVIMKDPRRGPTPTIAHTRANGTVLTERIGKATTSRAVSEKKPIPADLVQNWPVLASREVFAGLMDGRHPFSEYVGALLDPKNGYKVSVSERTLTASGGRIVQQYRILAIRDGASVKKLGASTIQLIVDGQIHLPVTMTASVQKPGKTEDTLAWDAKWTNNVKFDDKDFKPIPPEPVKT